MSHVWPRTPSLSMVWSTLSPTPRHAQARLTRRATAKRTTTSPSTAATAALPETAWLTPSPEHSPASALARHDEARARTHPTRLALRTLCPVRRTRRPNICRIRGKIHSPLLDICPGQGRGGNSSAEEKNKRGKAALSYDFALLTIV